ncbi:MAG: L-fucokinase [Aristaeellaceae bacterium]
MQHALTSLFHAQTYTDAWSDYQRALVNPGFPVWDYIILTASNAHQAEGFEAQLKQRSFPPHTHVAVLPDPDGKRVGSGGATLGVIRYIREQEAAKGHHGFDHLRILVIHSGGDSKRTPQYSALGKLFSPVPHELPDGRSSTLFDEFMIAMAGVPARIREGMLLLSGDVLLLFNPLQIDYSGSGAAAISFKEDVETGKNHGVYLRGEDGNVARCLQKQSVAMLRSVGAVNEQNRVDIDTGAVIFSPAMLASLDAMMQGREQDFINDHVRLSLYADFLYPLGSDATLEQFYQEKPEGDFSPELTTCRTAVWNALRPYRMKLLRLAPARFIHFGTTREIMRLMSHDIEEYTSLGWRAAVNSSVPEGVSGYNAVLSSRAQVGTPVHLETSYVHGDAVIGSNVLLSYVDICGERVPDNVVLHGLKQRDGRFVVRIYGVNDNPKEDKLFGKPLSDMGMTGPLWTAELYPVCATVAEGVKAALNVYAIAMGSGDRTAWEQAEKTSLCSGFNAADPDAIIAWDKRMHELVMMDRLAKDIRAKVPVSQLRSQINPDGLTKIQREWLDKRLAHADASEAMRLHYYLGRILNGAEGEKHIAEAFRQIQKAVISQIHLEENTTCRIVKDRHTVRLPLRVNWGGGWSDTPPYCLENGGTVLNAAILLNGQMPVEVTLERLPEKKIVFDSRDMDTHGEFTDIAQLQSVGDPYDPFVLQKAALLACGILPAEGGNLDEVLERLGGGILMKSEVTGVPKGSGLGTSSILAGACVKALFEFAGIDYTEDDLYAHVSVMEQIMSTGGGWQDQVGGLSTGVKYITTMPGLKQDIRVTHIKVPAAAWAELKERFVLIYTGQRRLARNLLRDVVGRYIGNEPDSLYALNEIQRSAALMRFELERGNIDAFARLLDEHWKLSQMIDAGSTNTLIDQIFASIDEYVDGKLVCGAGGGGFLQVVLKKGVTRAQVHARLKEIFQDSDVDVYDAELI